MKGRLAGSAAGAFLLFLGCGEGTGPDEEGICSLQSQIPQVECEALVTLYQATGGPGWVEFTGWMVEPTPCTWHGVTCDGSNVVEVELSSNGLSGFIPPELGDLSGLEALWLMFNTLEGSIPPELGNLSELEFLYINRNGLTGSIPPELGNLSRLRTLYLWGNDLEGAIPPVLGQLGDLVQLTARENRLSGPVPSELGNLSNVDLLDLSSNELTGAIPAELGGLTGLRLLSLRSNQLEGAVPLAVAQLGGQIEDAGGSCSWGPEGNDDLFLPDTGDYRAADLDGDGLICGVGFAQGGSSGRQR